MLRSAALPCCLLLAGLLVPSHVQSSITFPKDWQWTFNCDRCSGTAGPCMARDGSCAAFSDGFIEQCPPSHIKCGSQICNTGFEEAKAKRRFCRQPAESHKEAIKRQEYSAETTSADEKLTLLEAAYPNEAGLVTSSGGTADSCNRCSAPAVDCHPPAEQMCRWGCNTAQLAEFQQACVAGAGVSSDTSTQLADAKALLGNKLCMRHQNVVTDQQIALPTFFEDFWTPRWRGICDEISEINGKAQCPDTSSPCGDFLPMKLASKHDGLQGRLADFIRLDPSSSNPCRRRAAQNPWIKTWKCSASFKNGECTRDLAFASEQCGCAENHVCNTCRVTGQVGGKFWGDCVPQMLPGSEGQCCDETASACTTFEANLIKKYTSQGVITPKMCAGAPAPTPAPPSPPTGGGVDEEGAITITSAVIGACVLLGVGLLVRRKFFARRQAQAQIRASNDYRRDGIDGGDGYASGIASYNPSMSRNRGNMFGSDKQVSLIENDV